MLILLFRLSCFVNNFQLMLCSLIGPLSYAIYKHSSRPQHNIVFVSTRCTFMFRGGGKVGGGTMAFLLLLCLTLAVPRQALFQFLRCVFVLLAAFLSISLLASVFPVSLPLFFMRECQSWVGLLCMDALSCIHGVGR